jgi:23S rRNA (guanosine2251-2'-O)-methyltransferase
MTMPVAKTLLWGYHPVFEALRARRRELHTVYLAGGQGAPRRQAIADAARRAGVAVQWVEPDKLTALVGHRRHQDVAAEAAAYPVSALEEIVRACPAGTAGWVLLLDQIVDPQNFGAIVRTAHCAGIHGIVAPKDRSAPPSAAASKASAGALEHMRVAYVTNLVGAIKALKDSGFWIACADRNGRLSLFEADLEGPLALVIGGEEKGLRPLVKKHCDFTVAIPQTGPVGSLNASAAAAIVIYEAFRQRNRKPGE